MKTAELIFVTLSETGHLLSTIELSKRLIDLDRRISMITILSMKIPFAPHADDSVASLTASEPGIRYISLPEIKHTSSEIDFLDLVDKNIPSVRETIHYIISSSSSSGDTVTVAGLILDFFCVDLIDIGREFNLPSYIFMTANLGFLGLLQYLPERHRLTPSKFVISGEDDGELKIPAFANRVPVKVLPPGVFIELYYETFVKIGERLKDAKGILVNTAVDVEPHAAEHFSKSGYYPRVYPVGPVLNLTGRGNPSLGSAQYKEMMEWLDEQPESSVLFLCFGSMGVFTEPQTKQIAHALELVGVRFIWAIRNTNKTGDGDSHKQPLLPEGFIDRTMGRGIVCSWAPQVDILAHKATGGFVSHCGWNSIQESLWYGVPIATWPMYAEQQLNAFEIVKELGLAVEIRLDYVSDLDNVTEEIVSADEIATAFRSLMDGGNPIRKKVKEISALTRKAVGDGGSSMVATKEFIIDILGDHH